MLTQVYTQLPLVTWRREMIWDPCRCGRGTMNRDSPATLTRTAPHYCPAICAPTSPIQASRGLDFRRPSLNTRASTQTRSMTSAQQSVASSGIMWLNSSPGPLTQISALRQTHKRVAVQYRKMYTVCSLIKQNARNNNILKVCDKGTLSKRHTHAHTHWTLFKVWLPSSGKRIKPPLNGAGHSSI